MEKCTFPVVFQTYWPVFIATAKNATMTAQISWIGRILLSWNWQVPFKWHAGNFTERVPSQCKAYCVISSAVKNALWDLKVSSDHAPVALQRTVFISVGKVFCLRGGQEQRELKISQFVHSTDPDCYTYVENGSKNRSGVNTKETLINLACGLQLQMLPRLNGHFINILVWFCT